MNKITFRDFDRKHSNIQNKDPTEKKPCDIDFVMGDNLLTIGDLERLQERIIIERPQSRTYRPNPVFNWTYIPDSVYVNAEEEEEPEEEDEEEQEETNEDEDILF